jgi:hypothetical protein
MFAFSDDSCYPSPMGEMATLLQGTPGGRQVADLTTLPLLRRVVESLATMRPGRYTVYLGRPDPAAVRQEWEQEATLLRSARRAVVTTPETTPLPQEADRRDPGLGWLAHLWFSAVMGEDTAMAVICRPDVTQPEEAWLLTEPTAVRRFVAAVEGELARPDPQLLAV